MQIGILGTAQESLDISKQYSIFNAFLISFFLNQAFGMLDIFSRRKHSKLIN